MRHKKKSSRLGRSSAHKKALMAGLVCNLIAEKRIRTTVVKAKLARSFADKMVTLGKKGTLAARRQAIAKLRQKDKVSILFDTIAPSFKERKGGYTRVLKMEPRLGDNSEMAILEWVSDADSAGESKEKKTKKPQAKQSTKAVEPVKEDTKAKKEKKVSSPKDKKPSE